MNNVVSHKSMMDREIEAKVDARIKAVIASGRDPSDIGEDELKAMVLDAHDALSPRAKRQAAEQGLLHMAKVVIGERLAEEIWRSAKGWPSTERELRGIAKAMRIDPNDAPECLFAYREGAVDATYAELEVYRSLSRFAPLFLGAAADATLGEIATLKAARGDKLALSFLAWKEIA